MRTVLIIAILKSLIESVQIQINGIPGDKLVMRLRTKIRSERITVIVFFRHQRSFARFIAAEEKQSGKSENHRFFHYKVLYKNDEECL